MNTWSARIPRTIAVFIGGSLGAATAVAMSMPGPAPEAGRCPAPSTVASSATQGEPLLALGDRGILAAIDEGGSTTVGAPTVVGLARHASSSRSFGTVFVDDRDGGDALVTVGVGPPLVLPQQGDVFHPAWSPIGDLAWSTGTTLGVRDRSTGRTTTLLGPPGAVSVSYPIFLGPTRLVASVEERVEGLSSEFEGLNNLWEVELRSGRWTKLTSFTATADRFSVIRTPIVGKGGDVLFVRVHGVATRTRLPSFELWKLSGGAASLVRELGREMYIAGQMDGEIVWNVEDARGRWHLLMGEPSGRLRDLGCGRVSVDPLTRSDPDLAPTGVTGGKTEPPPPSPTISGTIPPATGLEAGLGILVGDFATREAAAMAVEVIGKRFGTEPTIIDASTQPTLIRPGVYAVVVPLVEGADLESELQRFRDLLPQTSTTSWIVAIP